MTQMNIQTSLAETTDAARRLVGHITTTEIIETPRELHELLGFNLFIKPESLQDTGSFKRRGTLNQLIIRSNTELFITASSGNNAIAASDFCQRNNKRLIVVVPDDAPGEKVLKIQESGAEIKRYNRETEDRKFIVQELADSNPDAAVIESSNSQDCINGAGTVGLEIYSQMSEIGVIPNAIITPSGGGGLAAGTAISAHFWKEAKPTVHTAEPEAHDKMRRSLNEGEIIEDNLRKPSICDALATQISKIPFEILKDEGVTGLAASEEEIVSAMILLYKNFGIIAEPSAAVAVACAIKNKDKFKGQNVVVVVSGGNISDERFGELTGIKPEIPTLAA